MPPEGRGWRGYDRWPTFPPPCEFEALPNMRKPRSICAGCPSLQKGLCGPSRHRPFPLGSVSWHRRFRAGDAIHVEGEVPPSFCAIVSGVVKLLKSLPNGSQQIVGLFAAGDFLGRPFGGEARATAIAASEVEICWFPRATIESLAASSGAVKDWLYQHVSDELEKAQEWIMLLGRMTAEQKMAVFLLSVMRATRRRQGGHRKRARNLDRAAALAHRDRRLSRADHRDREPADRAPARAQRHQRRQHAHRRRAPPGCADGDRRQRASRPHASFARVDA